jgi:Flp pilus assembly pilin Flp
MNQLEQYKKPSLLTKIRRRFKDRRGQSTTEYILILAIVVMIASKMRSKLDRSISGTIDKLDSSIQTINTE